MVCLPEVCTSPRMQHCACKLRHMHQRACGICILERCLGSAHAMMSWGTVLAAPASPLGLCICAQQVAHQCSASIILDSC